MFFPTYLEIRRTQILDEIDNFHKEWLDELGEVDKETLAKLRSLVSDFYGAKAYLALQVEGVEKLTADAIAKYQLDLENAENKFVSDLNSIKNYVLNNAEKCDVPPVTVDDNGKIMQVVNGIWKAVEFDIELGTQLPSVNANDNGKVLTVKDGKWSVETPKTPTIVDGSDLPDVTVDDDGKYLGVVNGQWVTVTPPTVVPPTETKKELPDVDETDDGKVLTVRNGEWRAETPSEAEVETELPSVSESDNGKVLGVVDGEWQKMNAPTGGGSTTIVAYEIPFFDLASMGLPTVKTNGITSDLSCDTSTIRSALDNGFAKFALNVEGIGRIEVVMNKYYENGLYICSHTNMAKTFTLMIAENGLQASVTAMAADVVEYNGEVEVV